MAKRIFYFDSNSGDTSTLLIGLGAFNAAITIALGALSMHALKTHLAENDLAGWFNVALQYHQYHSLGLIVVGLVARQNPSRWITWSGILMMLGILFFSGNLYLRSLADFHSLHAITPLGGASFIGSWILLALGVITQKSN